jgi:hypothetical protein
MPTMRIPVIVAVTLCATVPVVARTHHRVPKQAPPAAKQGPVTEPSANVPEKNRDPEDVALDRRIKGICRGC